MQFVFKRDEEGRERIYVGDVLAWQCDGDLRMNTGRGGSNLFHIGFTEKTMGEAIERAAEAGFWEHYAEVALHGCDAKWTLPKEVTVDVPVADTAVLSVTVGGDES